MYVTLDESFQSKTKAFKSVKHYCSKIDKIKAIFLCICSAYTVALGVIRDSWSSSKKDTKESQFGTMLHKK